MRISARLAPANYDGPFNEFRRFAEQRMEKAALIAVDVGRKRALATIRTGMQGTGLGRLGNGLGSTSDLDEGRGVHRRSNGFSASGTVFVRSGSERTRGAIESYTDGAEITPKRGRWMWIATDNIPRLTGRYRMTPELYIRNGFTQKIGPLIKVKGSRGYPVLIVKNVGVSAVGARRSAKSLTKRGLPRKGQVAQDFVVAFFAIPRTSRAARIDVAAIMREIANDLPNLFNQALGRI